MQNNFYFSRVNSHCLNINISTMRCDFKTNEIQIIHQIRNELDWFHEKSSFCAQIKIQHIHIYIKFETGSRNFANQGAHKITRGLNELWMNHSIHIGLSVPEDTLSGKYVIERNSIVILNTEIMHVSMYNSL
jgi:hypothetical protein